MKLFYITLAVFGIYIASALLTVSLPGSILGICIMAAFILSWFGTAARAFMKRKHDTLKAMSIYSAIMAAIYVVLLIFTGWHFAFDLTTVLNFPSLLISIITRTIDPVWGILFTVIMYATPFILLKMPHKDKKLKVEKILIVPNSFKGSITAPEAAVAMEKGILKAFPTVEIEKLPLADGGDGTLECLITALDGHYRECRVQNPLGTEITAKYGILKDNTAVIESAEASGMRLLAEDQLDPMNTSTYGTGELIKDAIEQGCKKIIVGIGGTATIDGGMGMAQALGIVFRDINGNVLGTGGKELINIYSISFNRIHPGLKNANIIAACDITNFLCGDKGAAKLFGPQKGADTKMIVTLNDGLLNLSERLHSMDKDILMLRGGGAGGGLCAGLVAFCGASVKSGFDIVSEITGLRDKIKISDLIFTGEGKTDSQSKYGKLPYGVAEIAAEFNKPVILISGDIDESGDSNLSKNFYSWYSVVEVNNVTPEYSMENASELLTLTAEKAAQKLL
ncbi:MAG: glycerate kinase [Clostridiales bacterium]|nr:glycerate kinase [Clostridiales bacterium]